VHVFLTYGAELDVALPRGAFRIVPDASWYVTHPLGKPAGGTYSELAFTQAALDSVTYSDHVAPRGRLEARAVFDELVRRIVVDLYGSAWAFTYPPEQFADAIERHGMRRRELVIVTYVDVIDDNPTREDRT
jgi:hypothetical protein